MNAHQPTLWRQAFDIGSRAKQAELLGTPPSEAHLVLELHLVLEQLDRELEIGRAATAVVVDSGARRHTIQVRANHCDSIMRT